MNWRTTAVLFAILVLLAGYLYYGGTQEPTPVAAPTADSPPPETAPLLEGVAAEEVTRLTVSRAEDGATAVFERDGGLWLMTAPTQTAVLSTTLNSAVNGLVNAASRRSFDPGDTPLIDYGLADPAYTIETGVGAGEGHRLAVGGQTPAEDAYYVQRGGDGRVHLAPLFTIDNLIRLLDEPPFEE